MGSKGKKEIQRGGALDSLYKFFLTLWLNLEPPKHEAVGEKKKKKSLAVTWREGRTELWLKLPPKSQFVA